MGRKMIDLTGQRFYRYLVLGEAGRNKWCKVTWKCQCDCGVIKIICGGDLKSGHIISCGCLGKERVSKANKIVLIGQRFCRWLVLEDVGRDKKGSVLWKCLCDCGNIKVIRGDVLRSGASKSCGCFQKEIVSEIMKNRIGKNSPRYNPDLTDEERQGWRCIPGYQEWHTAVFERDDYTCQCCGKRGGKLNAHHLESYRDNIELRTSLENGVTLCEECHRNFHHQYGHGNTREQFEEFFRAQKLKERNLRGKGDN